MIDDARTESEASLPLRNTGSPFASPPESWTEERARAAIEAVEAALRVPARLAALEATSLWNPERRTFLELVARLAARGLRVPVAQVNLITHAAQVPIASAAAGDQSDGRLP